MLFLLIIVRESNDGSIEIMGYQAFKLGNKTIMIKPPEGMIYSTEDSIKSSFGRQDSYFIIYGDSANQNIPEVFGELLQMGEITDFSALLDILEKDTTAEIINHKIENDYLTLKYKINKNENIYYLISRYYKSFPYYLNVKSVWQGGETVPEKVLETFNAIEAKR